MIAVGGGAGASLVWDKSLRVLRLAFPRGLPSSFTGTLDGLYPGFKGKKVF